MADPLNISISQAIGTTEDIWLSNWILVIEAIGTTETLSITEWPIPFAISVSDALLVTEAKTASVPDVYPYQIESAAYSKLYPASTLEIVDEYVEIESEAILNLYVREMEEVEIEPIIPYEFTSTVLLDLTAEGIRTDLIEPITSTANLAFFVPSGFVSIEPFRFISGAVIRLSAPFGFDLGDRVQLETEALFRLASVSYFVTAPTPYVLVSEALLQFPAVKGFEIVVAEYPWSVPQLNLMGASSFTLPSGYQFTGSGLLIYSLFPGFTPQDVVLIESEAVYRYSTAAIFQAEAVVAQIRGEGILEYEAVLGIAPEQEGYQFDSRALLILSTVSGFTPPDVVLIETEAVVRYSTAAVFQSIVPTYQFVSEALVEYESVGQYVVSLAYQFASAAIIIHSIFPGFTPLDKTQVESEGIIRFSSVSSFPTAPEPIGLVSEAQLKLSTLVGFAVSKDAYQFISEALFKYIPNLALERVEVAPFTSEALLKVLSGSVLQIGGEAYQLLSEALVKFASLPGFTFLEAEEAFQFSSNAVLLYQQPEGIAPEISKISINSWPTLYLYDQASIDISDQALALITSRAEFHYIGAGGIEAVIVTEPTAVELTSEAGLIYGGLTGTLIRLVAEIEAAIITSGAMFSLISEDTIGLPSLVPYQFSGGGVLDYLGQGAVLFVEQGPETMESGPVLVLGGEVGVVEDELYETWVFTTDAWHPSMYSNWNFNSYIEIDGVQYGAKEDGIYLLEGQDDDGQEIRPALRLFTNFGVNGLKRIRMVQAERCGDQATLYVSEPIDDTGRDFALIRKCFRGTRDIMGREFILDFQDFEELGHLKVVPMVMIRDGREG